MVDVREATRELLSEKPIIESDLRTLLRIDSEHETWDFEDVPFDSGTFGEIVSRGIVEEASTGYRLAEPAAIRAVVEDDNSLSTEDRPSSITDVVSARVDTRVVVAVAGSIGFLIFLRVVFAYSAVFRGDAIVLAGNDPYYYRYWVEELLRSSAVAFDLSSLGDLPRAVREGDVLMIVVLWLVSALFGGDATAAGLTVALYPVVAAALSGVCVYIATVRVTSDRRVAIAAVLLLALTPVHAFRTALGFGDHHAFDLFWLSTLTVGIVMLETVVRSDDGPPRVRDRRVAVWTTVIGVSIAAISLAWRGGPLLLLPLAPYVVFRTLLDVRDGHTPERAATPLLGALGTGAVVTFVAHVSLDWVSAYRALAPALLFLGSLAVVLVAVATNRARRSLRATVTAELLSGALLVLGAAVLPTGFLGAVSDGVTVLTAQETAAETLSLFSGQLGLFVSPVLLFGFVLFLALPPMVSVTLALRERQAPGWLFLVTGGWYFLVLAIVQIRFAGALSLFTAVFGAVGLAVLTDLVDITTTVPSVSEMTDRRPLTALSWPGRDTAGRLLVVFLLVTSISFVQIPVKVSQIAVDDATYETAAGIADHAERTWSDDSRPYVLSSWGQNRVYNYFASGWAESTTYARTTYPSFLSATDPAAWYERLESRVRYVVVTDITGYPPESVQTRLYNGLGAGQAGSQALSHYQMVRSSEDGSTRAFALVPGATLTGTAPPNGTLTIRTDVSVPGRSFTYNRTVQTTMDGRYAVTVPYAGEYDVSGERVSVSETAVAEGRFDTDPTAGGHWRFDAGRGEVVFDSAGGNHGRADGAQWVDGIDGRALEFDGSGHVTVPERPWMDDLSEFTVSLWVKTDENSSSPFPGLVGKRPATNYGDTDGFLVNLYRGDIVTVLGNGTDSVSLDGPNVRDGRWHHVAATWNGTHVQLYVDGSVVDTGRFEGEVSNEQPLVVGAAAVDQNRFVGEVDEVRLRPEAAGADLLRLEYNESFRGQSEKISS